MGGSLTDSNATNDNDNTLVVIADNTTPSQRAGVTSSNRLKVDVLQSGTIADSNQLFSVALDLNMASSGTENPLLLFKNPSGSGKTMKILLATGGTNIANVSAVFRFYKNPTITTNGTSVTPERLRVGDAYTSSIEAYYFPTLSSNGTEIVNAVCGQNTQSVNIVTGFNIFVRANSNIVLTGNPGSNNRNAAVTVIWAEE